LASLARECSWLRLTTAGSLWRLLDRLGISYKRGREYVHSPDEHYQDKLALIEQCRQRAQAEPERYVLLYLDEFTYYRQPSVGRDYERQGHTQPLARRSHQRNHWFRVVATLDGLTGQVTYRQRRKIDVLALGAFLSTLPAEYPQAEVIFVVVDNWPVHFHPDVLAYLQPQNLPWPPYVPPHWSRSRQPPTTQLPIQLLCLPTYASWCNPTEKLWRWLKQQELHQHRLSDDWPGLKQRVAERLDACHTGSPELLRYTGLLARVNC
jgi:DDE superfamily endonuclease